MRSSSKLWRSILVLVLWAPVPLMAAIPALAPPLLGTELFGVPLSVWVVVAVIVVLVGLSWLFSAADDAEQRERS